MQIEPTEIADVKLLTPRKYADARGFFMETYSLRVLAAAGIDAVFVQDNHSLSIPCGTVRGLHYQTPPHAQGKLVRVLRGRVLDVAVDIRRSSATFGRHVGVELDAASARQIWVPPGFAHAFCTLEPDTEVAYKVTDFYAPDCDRGLLWNDPALGIDWPISADAAVLSEKDARHPLLADAADLFD